MTQAAWFQKNGFDKNGLTWIVFGEDTYAIKEQLKELGCKYHRILKWHSPVAIDVPCGYGIVSINFNDICQWDEHDECGYFLIDSENYINNKIMEAAGPSSSEYMYQVGERIREVSAIYKGSRRITGKYGDSNIYTFTIDGNTLNWFTTVTLDIKPGSEILLTGTVKRHEEYKGVKTTQLSRCKIQIA